MSPFGVNTKTWSWKMSSFTPSTNSVASDDLPLPVHQLAQPGELRVVLAIRLGAFLVPPVRGDARPRETWCIACVRIWISSGLPSIAITAVWSDWYRLFLGTAM